MIDIGKLQEKDRGRWVTYNDGFETENGRIKSWNEMFVFVVYKCESNWNRFQDYTGCATEPEDLEFAKGGQHDQKVKD